MDAVRTPDTVRALVEAGCLGADPVAWLLDSAEPFAVWATLVGVLDLPTNDPGVSAAHDAVLGAENVRQLVDQLPSRPSPSTTDHHSPSFLPNRLNLLAEMGVARGDFEKLDAVLDSLLAAQDRAGRYRVSGPARPRPNVDSHRCDNNAIVEVLARFGHGEEPAVARALARVVADATPTTQGQGWCCVPERQPTLRLPSRRAAACPQITLEGLRCIAMLPADKRPKSALDAARTPLEVWRRRSEERPYQFGHGYQFKTVKWPSFWYDALSVLDAVGLYPQLWQGPDAREEDRRSLAEIAACLIAYNVDRDGRVTPRRVHRGLRAVLLRQQGRALAVRDRPRSDGARTPLRSRRGDRRGRRQSAAELEGRQRSSGPARAAVRRCRCPTHARCRRSPPTIPHESCPACCLDTTSTARGSSRRRTRSPTTSWASSRPTPRPPT